MPPLVFTLEEAVAVVLGTGIVEEMWGDLYREAARGALAKLEYLLPEEQAREVSWARGSLIATGMHRADLKAQTPALEKLRRAIREHRSVDMNYQSSQVPHPSSRLLDPYALVHRWGWWYVIGYCHVHKEIRTFRVDRITGISLMDGAFSQPSDFDLHAYLNHEMQTQPQVVARLRFEAEAAHILGGNQAYWETIEPQPDGSVEATFSAPSLEWAASTTLAYGPAVEVLAPPELRALVTGWLEAAIGKYKHER
jgi:predicted DNA-binding transcriptional regulator YafY